MLRLCHFMLCSCFPTLYVVQHCVCCIWVSLCSANPCKKCGLGRKEHPGWLHNSLLHLCTPLHTTSYTQQLNSTQSEVKLSHFCTTLQTTFFARHLKSTLSNPTPPRVFIAGYIGAPEWRCHLNFTSYCWQRCWVSQDQPKLKLAWVHSLGVVLHWILLSVTEIAPPPHKLRKTLTHWKPVKIVIVIEHQGGGLTILNAT